MRYNGFRIRGMLKPLWLLLFLFCVCFNSHCQSKSFATVDSCTYAQYLKGDWEGLIKDGKGAIGQGIDYFYLRMRMAYAYYMRGQYGLAIPHYIRALGFNPNDRDAQFFLLNCYEFTGRRSDAIKFSSRLSETVLSDAGHNYEASVLGFGIVYSYANADVNGAIEQIRRNRNLGVKGVQKATNFFNNTNAFLMHRLGKSVVVNHSLNYLYKSDYDYLTGDGKVLIVEDQPLHQSTYGIDMRITPFLGFSVTPGFRYIFTNVPLDTSSDLNVNSLVYSLMLRQHFKNISVGSSVLGGTLNDIQVLQLGGNFTWYPKGNLNLYYSFDGYWQKQSNEAREVYDFIHKHILGLKLTDYWWAEASVLLPEVGNFYDFSNGALYNSLEGNKNVISLSNIFMVKNSRVSYMLGASFSQVVSSFVPSNNSLVKNNSISYNNITLTGGLIWKL